MTSLGYVNYVPCIQQLFSVNINYVCGTFNWHVGFNCNWMDNLQVLVWLNTERLM